MCCGCHHCGVAKDGRQPNSLIVISFFNESCYFRWLRGGNVVLLLAHFIHLLLTIHPLSMMSLLHTIYRFFYYRAHPIANDVYVIGLARKASTSFPIALLACILFLSATRTTSDFLLYAHMDEINAGCAVLSWSTIHPKSLFLDTSLISEHHRQIWVPHL